MALGFEVLTANVHTDDAAQCMRVSQALEAGTVSPFCSFCFVLEGRAIISSRPCVIGRLRTLLNLFRRFTSRFTSCDDLTTCLAST